METAFDKPRFRNDLVAQYIEDGGVQYVDVTDPNSGNTFRFYDVEYSIACAMNGDRDIAGLVEWTKAELGLDTSADELAGVVTTLKELGYLDAGAAGVELGAPGKSDMDIAPPRREAAPSIELGAPGASEVAMEAAPPPPADDVELGLPGKSELPLAAEAREAAPSIELGPPGAGEAASPRAEKKPGTADDMSFAGLMGEEPTRISGPRPEDVAASKIPSSADITPPPAEPPSEVPLRQASAKVGADDEPTNLPRPMTEPDDEDVSVDLSAHISLDKNAVGEAVRASKVMDVPEIPADLLEEDRKQAAADAVAKAEAAEKPAMPLPPPPTPAAPKPPAVGQDRPGVKPIEATKAPPAMEHAAKKGGGGGLFLLVAVLLVGAAGVYWWFFIRSSGDGGNKPAAPTQPAMGGGSGPAPTGPGPSGGGTPPPAAGPVVAKLERRAAVPTEARAASDGVVAWLADPSKDATADEPLVKLQGFQKWQLQKQQASQRLEFYTAELEKAKTANEASAISYNEKKVEEKKGLVSQAEDELAKVVVPAPASGKMELLVKVGQAVKAGDVVAKITGGAPQLTGTFDAGAAAADYQAPGAACAVAAKGSPDKRAACVVEGVEGSKVTVRLVEGSPFAAGDEVELLPARK